MNPRARSANNVCPRVESPSSEDDTVVHASRLQLVPMLPSDAELVAQIGDADEDIARRAFSTLYVTYCVLLIKWAYYFTRDRAVAEEVVADVLADLWHRRQTWAPQGSVEAYLFSAVRTHIRQDRRNTSRRVTLTTYFVPAGESPAMSEPVLATDSAVQSDDLRIRLDQALAGLSGRSRAAVMYRWYDGLEYDEIALRLGTTAGAVRVLVTRALKTLRTLIARP